MKNQNTLFYIIGAIILVALIIFSQVPKETGMISLTPHYYKDGVEVIQKGFFGFTIVTPDGGSYDQISFGIPGNAVGDISFSDIQIADAYPLILKNSLPSTTQSLSVGQSKTLWTSNLIDAVQFEGQIINFWVEVSAVNDYTGETVYSPRAYSGEIGFEAEIQGWDLSTAIYEGEIQTLDNAYARDLFFRPDGVIYYELGDYDHRITKHRCTIPWEITSCSWTGGTMDTPTIASYGIFFKPDGTKMYVASVLPDRIYQYSCSIPWGLNSCSLETSMSASQDIFDLFFKPDGTKLYIISGRLRQYSCSVAWDISSCIDDDISSSTQFVYYETNDLFFKPDGTKLYLLGGGADYVYQHTCSAAWDLSSCSYDGISVLAMDSRPYGFFFKPDGTRMYIMGMSSGTISQHNLGG